jgi:hypothetical protein
MVKTTCSRQGYPESAGQTSWSDRVWAQCEYMSLCKLFLCYLCCSCLWFASDLIYKYSRFGTLDLHSNLGRPSSAKPSQASNVGSPPGCPQSTRQREDVGSVYFWKEARMDSFAAAPLTPLPLKYVSMSPSLHVSLSCCLVVSLSPCFYVHESKFLEFCIRKMELTENSNFRCFMRTGNGNGQLPFACCKWIRKTDIYFPWSANSKR